MGKALSWECVAFRKQALESIGLMAVHHQVLGVMITHHFNLIKVPEDIL